MLVLCHLSVMLSIMSQSSGENRETCRSVRQENTTLFCMHAVHLPCLFICCYLLRLIEPPLGIFSDNDVY